MEVLQCQQHLPGCLHDQGVRKASGAEGQLTCERVPCMLQDQVDPPAGALQAHAYGQQH
jgi:hypothetical protein